MDTSSYHSTVNEKIKWKKLCFESLQNFVFVEKKWKYQTPLKTSFQRIFGWNLFRAKFELYTKKIIGRLGEGKIAFLLDQYCNMYCSEGFWNKKSMKYIEKKNTNMNNVLNRWEVKNDLPLVIKSINPRADRTTTAIFEKRMQSAAINPNFNQVKKSLWSFVMR